MVPVALLTIWLAGLAAGPDRIRRLLAYPVKDFPTAIGADRALAAVVDAGLALTFTAANVAGFPHGFVLFCSLPLDLGLPFGGSRPSARWWRCCCGCSSSTCWC